MTVHPRLPRSLTVAYGLVVVTAFGSWFYGYGVLVDPIGRDTGWSEAWVSTAYGAGLFAVGVGAVLGGRLLDRRGPRLLFVTGAVGATAGGAVSATAATAVVFVPAAVLTHCFIGAVGYYAAVHATISVLAPQDRTRAITVNTLWGAFASPVFLPLMAWLATVAQWRGAMAIGTALTVAAFLLAAALSPAQWTSPAAHSGRSILGDLSHAVRDPRIRRMLAVALLGGMTFSVLILYQVPAMVTAGLALGTASALAGLRGLFQLAGRLPLPWLVSRLGAGTFFRISLALVGLSALLLPFSGSIAIAVLFAAVAGFAVGAFSTMESIYTAELVPVASIGMVLGAYTLVRGFGSAIGPAAAGVLSDTLDSRVPALLGIAGLALVGALVAPSAHSAQATKPRTR